MSKEVVTIQKTSKSIKGQMLFAGATFALGVIVLALSGGSWGGLLLILLGCTLQLHARFRQWWNHG